jgi:hypothetical protein
LRAQKLQGGQSASVPTSNKKGGHGASAPLPTLRSQN